jgi:hypothetical protein
MTINEKGRATARLFFKNYPMKPIRSKPLIVAVIVISAAIIAVTQLAEYASWSLRTRQITGYSAFGLNCVIAILGFWTRHRRAWMVYLVVSVATFFLISASTPLSGLWILLIVVFDSLSRH